MVDKQSKIPLYLQLMDELIHKIQHRKYKENEKLPSERQLCEIYDMSRITVRQALQELEREGYIYKLHGKGTFVKPKSINQNLVQLYSFTDEMKKLGKKPETKVVEFEKIVIDANLSKKMDLEPLATVIKVVRLRLADNEPLMFETSYIPEKLLPGLQRGELEEKPMYDVFRDKYHLVVNKVREKFSATAVMEEEAAYLQMETGMPAMLIRRYAYYNNLLIEYTVSIVHGDKFDYTVELT